MIYYQSAFLTIAWDEAGGLVAGRYVGFAEGEELRIPSDKIIDLLREKGATKLLANMLEVQVLSQEDQRWINTDWVPRAVAAGLHCIAIVVPTSALAKMSVRFVLTKMSGFDFVVSHFDDEKQAREWLRAQR